MPSDSGNKSVIIWGIHPVKEFLEIRPDACQGVFAVPSFGKKKAQKGLLRLAEENGVLVTRSEDLTNSGVPSGAVHQGVAALVRPIWSIDFSLVPRYLKDENSLVVVCDQLTDPQNVGAVIRSSVAMGAQVVVLPGHRTAKIAGAVAKASSGALFHMKVCQAGNISAALKKLKDMGLWVVGLSPDGTSTLWELDLVRPLAMVVGAEDTGLRRLVRETCDFLAHIPHLGPIGSMNVASAAGIALYEVARQRRSSPVYAGPKVII